MKDIKIGDKVVVIVSKMWHSRIEESKREVQA